MRQKAQTNYHIVTIRNSDTNPARSAINISIFAQNLQEKI